MSHPDVLDRFMSKVEFAECGCWLWKAALDTCGYGRFRVHGKTRGAHRWAYEMFVGPIPEKLTIDHLCRVRNCVNPDHLEPVTQGVNTLRGNTFQAKNAAKTHCPQGHEYDLENTMMWRGRRQCRSCHRKTSLRYYYANKERKAK